MILPIVAYGDPVLRKVGKEIDKDYPELDTLIANMKETMYNASGVGLAAPQIGKATRLFIIDYNTRKSYLISLIPNAASFSDAQTDIDFMLAATKKDQPISFKPVAVGDLKSDTNEAQYLKTVATLKEHIYQGDIFQAVYGRMQSATFSGDAYKVYTTLKNLNPSPYMFYMRDHHGVLLGCSPELHLSVKATDAQEREVAITPIAGTKPRGFRQGSICPELDQRYAIALQTDEKELAEHVMLIDLARNDIASIAGQVMPGSIALTADYDNNAGSGDTEAAVYLFSMAIALCLAVSSLKLYTEVEKAPLEFPTGLLNPAIPAEEPALLDQQEDLVVEEGGDSDSIFNWRPGPDNDDPEDDVFFDAQGDQGQRGGLRNEGLDDDVFLAALEERGNSDNIGYIRSDPKLSAQRSRYDLSELEGEIPSPEVNPIDSFQSASPEFSPGK